MLQFDLLYISFEKGPNFYSFIGADTIRRQAVLCHRVLRTLQLVAQTSTIMTHETWEALLIFMLAINETLLATPTIKGSTIVNLICLFSFIIIIIFFFYITFKYTH